MSVRSALPAALLLGCATTSPVANPLAKDDSSASARQPPSVSADAFRDQPPPLLATRPPFVAPIPKEARLKNGARLLVIESHVLPLVAIQINVNAGFDQEPSDKAGLSEFLADALLEGTTIKSAAELEIAKERFAAQLSIESGFAATYLRLNALKETLPEALALAAEVLIHPAFRPQDMERLRGQTLTGLAQKTGDAKALAEDDFKAVFWGQHTARGRPTRGTPDTVKAITVEDLVRFHRTWFVPNNTLISVAGDVTVEEMTALLDTALKAWKPHRIPAKQELKLPPPAPRRIVFTDVPTAAQSQVTAGWHAPPLTDPDAVPLMLVNVALGGVFSSRLNQNLREQKGYSYGIWSGLWFWHGIGSFSVSGAIQAPHTAEAVTEFVKELERLHTGEVTDEEMARAKETLIHRIPGFFETNGGVASAFASRVELGVPLNYYATLADRIRAVTKDDFSRAAQKYVLPDRWPLVVVGPKANCLEPLRALQLGEVTELAAP